MLRRVLILLFVIAAFSVSAAAVSFSKEAAFPLAPGSRLRVDMPVGEFLITGGGGSQVAVQLRVEVKRGSPHDIERRIEIRFHPGPDARLEIRTPEGVSNIFNKVEVRAEIRVPARTDLRAELGVGEMRVTGIEGNLRAHVGVGELRLEIPDKDIYRWVKATSGVGEVRHPFGGRTSGWLGKEYRGEFAQGEYRLEADVGVGEVTISRPHML